MYVEDLVEFKDDGVDNVILYLRRPQDIWHPTIPALAGSAEIAVNNTVDPPVRFQAAVTRRDKVDAWSEK